MDSGAVDSPVTLVIKAPNQKYEDQTINCFLNWTVEKLKSHISSVYPSKPLSKDQRLVYSGMLLQDHLQLRDVLRKHDEYHMMHLVCTSHSPPGSPMPRSPSSTTASDSSVSRSTLTNTIYLSLNEHFFMSFLWYHYTGEGQFYNQAAVAASQPPSTSPPSSPTPSPHQPAQPNAVQPPLGPNAAPNALPENQPPNPIQMNAQGGAVLNDDEMNRDWLDWLYTLSRVGVLLSIVYFYSSFSRFVMVVGAMLLVYLHQAGWFPFRPEQQNLRGGGGVPQEEAERHQDIGEDGGGRAEDQGRAAAAAAVREPSFITVAWSFISTFFTSLIPEGRPHADN
uniref:Homocysteine-responsive endoplasmic reticulum-resident ubiquitin-like domain member 2 protein n=1 Tax=Neolamprologus brichardi TaxID=32507 RepID=A0A3Q4MTD4_NEOBR